MSVPVSQHRRPSQTYQLKNINLYMLTSIRIKHWAMGKSTFHNISIAGSTALIRFKYLCACKLLFFVCCVRCLSALCRADLVQNKELSSFNLHSAENHTAKTRANHCYQIISYCKIINSCFQITRICCARLLEKHKVFVVPASRSKQSHLSLLSWKLTSASEQFNLVRTLLRCWPLRQHVCGKNSMVEGRTTPADEHPVVDMTYIPREIKKKIKSCRQLNCRTKMGKEMSVTISKTLRV